MRIPSWRIMVPSARRLSARAGMEVAEQSYAQDGQVVKSGLKVGDGCGGAGGHGDPLSFSGRTVLPSSMRAVAGGNITGKQDAAGQDGLRLSGSGIFKQRLNPVVEVPIGNIRCRIFFEHRQRLDQPEADV